MSDNVAASAKHEAKLAATVEEHDAALVKLQREMQADAKQLIVSTTQELAEAQEQHQTETAALQAALHAAAEAASSSASKSPPQEAPPEAIALLQTKIALVRPLTDLGN